MNDATVGKGIESSDTDSGKSATRDHGFNRLLYACSVGILFWATLYVVPLDIYLVFPLFLAGLTVLSAFRMRNIGWSWQVGLLALVPIASLLVVLSGLALPPNFKKKAC